MQTGRKGNVHGIYKFTKVTMKDFLAADTNISYNCTDLLTSCLKEKITNKLSKREK